MWKKRERDRRIDWRGSWKRQRTLINYKYKSQFLDRFPAHRAAIIAIVDPQYNTFAMEVVLWVTLQQSYFVRIHILHIANRTRLLMLKSVRIELLPREALYHLLNWLPMEKASWSLVQVPNRQNDARETEDDEAIDHHLKVTND
jgi:hypothetical protein